MATHRFASLPFDVARCVGTHCTTKRSCARHKQIERDQHNEAVMRGDVRVACVDAMRMDDECSIRIEEV
jgi:ribosomal protein S3AE